MAFDEEVQKELEEIGPVLSRVSRTPPFAPPPSGYFEQLPSTMLEEVKRAKVISLPPRRGLWRLALAACIAGVLIAGGWLFVGKHSAGTPDLAGELSTPSIQKGIQELSVSEMTNYIDGNDIPAGDEVPSAAPIKDEDLKLVLADVSDQDLQLYLDQDVSPKLN